MSELPIFAYCAADVQASQLREYLKQLGAPIETQSQGEEKDALELVTHCTVIGQKNESVSEIEMVLNSIVSLIVAVPRAALERVALLFCEKLCGPEFRGKAAPSVVQVLSNLFHGFSELDKRTLQSSIYCSLLKVAGGSGLIRRVQTNLATLNKWFEEWEISVADKRACLRLLHEALNRGGLMEQSASVMLELLGTYTDADAASARDDAFEAIRTAILDPSTFIFDHLLALRPVQVLAKEKIYALLQIFVSGTLADYIKFYDANADYMATTLKLSHEANLHKMRILTLMSLAENKTQISFDELTKNLQLAQGEELEEFVIKAVMTKVIRAKIDELGERLVIGGVRNRQFGSGQWEQLRARLEQWEANLTQVNQTLEAAVAVES